MIAPVAGGQGTMLSAAEAASLLGWWIDAGVDTVVAEHPRVWTRPSEPAGPAAESVAATLSSIARPATNSASRPRIERLEDYHAWLREGSDLPLFQAGAARALPHGPAHAPIMLVVELPGRECAEEGRPLGGQAWELTTRMLAAIGFRPDEAYVASLSCFAAPGNRLAGRAAAECAEEMRRHIALVSPKRLLLMGDGPAQALLGQGLVEARGRVHRIDQVPAVVTFHPRQLLQRPSDKAYAWRDLLLLMSEEVS